MPLAKCPRTGKVFDNSQGPVHLSVMDEEKADYEKVLDYVAQNPGATPKELSKETGVDPACIIRLKKDGRLEEIDEEVEMEKEKEARKAEKRHLQSEAERKNQLMAGLANQKKPAAPKRVSGVHDTLGKKRR